MTISEAKRIARDFGMKCGDFTEEELYLCTEALGYLIQKTEDARYMLQLGSIYYEQKI